MKTSELTGAALDYWVAKAEGFELDEDGDNLSIRENGGTPSAWHPSTDWNQGGPIMEHARIATIPQVLEDGTTVWHAECWWIGFCDRPDAITGHTKLVAAMRAYVFCVFGPDVDASGKETTP